MAMKPCKECGQEVSSSAKKCPHCGAKLKGGILKKLLIGAGGVIIIIIIASIGTETGNGPSPSPSQTGADKVETETPKEWVDIFTFTGQGDKKSAHFELTGGPAKILYELRGEMSMLYVYVMKEGEILMETGGFPEITIEGAESGESYLHKRRGKYYLDVTSANGRWNIIIQEER